MDMSGLALLATAVGAFALYIIRTEVRGDVTRLDGRINTHEKECAERQRKLDERHRTLTAAIGDVHRDVEKVDAKLDRLLTARFGQ